MVQAVAALRDITSISNLFVKHAVNRLYSMVHLRSIADGVQPKGAGTRFWGLAVSLFCLNSIHEDGWIVSVHKNAPGETNCEVIHSIRPVASHGGHQSWISSFFKLGRLLGELDRVPLTLPSSNRGIMVCEEERKTPRSSKNAVFTFLITTMEIILGLNTTSRSHLTWWSRI